MTSNFFFLVLTTVTILLKLPACTAVKVIKTSTECEEDTMKIECRVGEVIIVKSANYGRTDEYTCIDFFMEDNCSAASSLQVTSDKCNNKQRCSIHASNDVFGDPCSFVPKYLTVQYECLPVIKTSTACDGQTMTIECPVGELINVKSANYGRTDDHTCAHFFMAKWHCSAVSSLKVTRDNCNNKQRCSIDASSAVFGDPCYWIPKYLTVQYECLPGPKWVHWQAGDLLPAYAVEAGRDDKGAKIYVGRCQHDGDLLPAKVVPQANYASVTYQRKEIRKHSCEILCQVPVKWKKDSEGSVPAGAIHVGRTSDGVTLYACRVHHKGGVVAGKVHPSHGACYIPFHGEEITYYKYEVLTF